ncbi:MAG: DUF3050 domain-containing protein [Flavobacteriales bacterium]|nr:DUF3050 domain-containing protein [Flavobacteriales bacterium]
MIERLEQELAPLKKQLLLHPLYEDIQTPQDLKQFTEAHIYAVWDFMSLVKKLQLELTTVHLPWQPSGSAATARLINEIVWGEESDINKDGVPMSHFEMYLEAMADVNADTQQINLFLKGLPNKGSVLDYLKSASLPDYVKDFLYFTFETIETRPLYEIAAVFTFGREDLIPDMFIEMLQRMNVKGNESLANMLYYFERHIEVDGDQHGPMALEMISNLCQNDSAKWEAVIARSKQALQHRINLWTGIHSSLMLTPTL